MCPILRHGRNESGNTDGAPMIESGEENAMELRQSQSILRAALEVTADGILVTDQEGRVLYVNTR